MSKFILTRTNRGAPDPIGLHNIDGDQINPATEDTLELLTKDDTFIELTVEILRQLKIMNIHLSMITGQEIRDFEVEVI